MEQKLKESLPTLRRERVDQERRLALVKKEQGGIGEHAALGLRVRVT